MSAQEYQSHAQHLKEQAKCFLKQYFNLETEEQFELPKLSLINNPFNQNAIQYSPTTDWKELGIEMHSRVESYLRVKILRDSQIEEKELLKKRLGVWMTFIVDSVWEYLRNYRQLDTVLVEYTTTCSSLTKRMDAIFYNKNHLTIVDWKYSDKSIWEIISKDPGHFRDQLFECAKQFSILDVSIMIVPLRKTDKFELQELSSRDLLREIGQISMYAEQYEENYCEILKEIQNDISLLLSQTSLIGRGKLQQKSLLYTVGSILKYNSKQQISYYLNVNVLHSPIQPKNKNQFWIIHTSTRKQSQIRMLKFSKAKQFLSFMQQKKINKKRLFLNF